MNFGKINKADIANGTGVRVSLFVSGCRNRCKGCFNPEAWSFSYGEPFTADTVKEILKALAPDYISGLTILGGDPMECENVVPVENLCRQVKSMYPDKTIWIYTGYSWEDVRHLPMMLYADVLVDGRFIEAEKDLTLKFRGSRNQRIIDVQKSSETKKVELWRF